VWGIAANLANIVVLTRRKMVSPTNAILTWLAVADLLTMTIYLPFCFNISCRSGPQQQTCSP